MKILYNNTNGGSAEQWKEYDNLSQETRYKFRNIPSVFEVLCLVKINFPEKGLKELNEKADI